MRTDGLACTSARRCSRKRRDCGGTRSSGVGQGSSLVLSSVLFDSILERSAPLSTNAIKHLRKSPMDLDVYAWLVHRLYHLTSINMITWSQLSGQFGHGYSRAP